MRNLFVMVWFKAIEMKKYTSLVILTSLTIAFAGCANHSSTAGLLKIDNLGVIEVSDGKLSSHTLGDGRVCTVTATVLPFGYINLETTIYETNALGVKTTTLIMEHPFTNLPITFNADKDRLLVVTLHNSK